MNIPTGQRYSQVYLKNGEPIEDSSRFRVRIAAIYIQRYDHLSDQLSNAIHTEFGVEVERTVMLEPYIQGFIKSCAPRDLLDFLWLVAKMLDRQSRATWISDVARIMKEENLKYRIDRDGGVHPLVDSEFEKNRVLALRCLQDPRYNAVADAFEKSHNNLDKDTKVAVRYIFEATEILYKRMTNENKLEASGAEKNIVKFLESIYNNDITALNSSKVLLTGFKPWINALHLYRHGQGTEEPIAPPLELAIEFISLGATYIRWLVAIDQKRPTT